VVKYQKILNFKFLLIFLSVFAFKLYADEFDDFMEASKNQRKSDTVRDEIINPGTIQSGEVLQKMMAPPKPKQAPKEPPLDKKILSSFKQWTVLSATPKGKDMCYSVVYSKRRVGNIENSEDAKAYFMVHYFSAYKQRVSVFLNYKLKLGSKVTISVDGNQFELQPLENYAFSEDAETDTGIISKLLTAKRILVRGEGDENTYSVDEYEATGFSQVYAKMKESCGGTR
jgi:hypothetical protein